jgi:hypothetical protein
VKWSFVVAVESMTTTFVKLMQHVPAGGWMAICQRGSRLWGNRGRQC